MGKFDDLKDLADLLEKLDADEDITVEVVKSREELDKRLKELDEDGYTMVGDEPKKEPKKKYEDELEEMRKSALKARKDMDKKIGKEAADKHVACAAANSVIKTCLELDIPIPKETFEEYNKLCEEVFPERCDPFMLGLTYMMLDHMREEGVKSLE